jgi:hypothetical protein
MISTVAKKHFDYFASQVIDLSKFFLCGRRDPGYNAASNPEVPDGEAYHLAAEEAAHHVHRFSAGREHDDP